MVKRDNTIRRGWKPNLIWAWLAGQVCTLAAQEQATQPAPSSTNIVVVTNIVYITNVITAPYQDVGANEVWLPPQDGFDWVQLTSGEWLKGKIKAMQDRELEFDSEELDDQTFDWKDVLRLRSPRIFDVLFLDGQKASGSVEVGPDHVLVDDGAILDMPRNQVLGLTPGGAKERNYWSGKASLGVTVRAGNTEQVDYNAQAHLQRRTPATRFTLDYIGVISRVDGVESANNHRVNSEFDVWFSQRFYVIVPFAEYYKDKFHNLEYRLTVGTGIGYDIIDRSKVTWSVHSGPAYQYAKFDSTLPGEPSEKSGAAWVFGSHFDWDITRRIELILDYRGQYTSRAAGETTHHGIATLSMDLTQRLDFDISLIWDRVSKPQVESNGDSPKQDDFRLVLGLGVDF